MADVEINEVSDQGKNVTISSRLQKQKDNYPLQVHEKLVAIDMEKINKQMPDNVGHVSSNFKDFAMSLMVNRDYDEKEKFESNEKARRAVDNSDDSVGGVPSEDLGKWSYPKSDDQFLDEKQDYHALWRVPEHGNRFVLLMKEEESKGFYTSKTVSGEIENEWLQNPFKMLKYSLGIELPNETSNEQTLEFQLSDTTTVKIALDVELHRADQDRVAFQCDESLIRLYAKRETKAHSSDHHNQSYEMDYTMSVVSGTKQGYSKINKSSYVYQAAGPLTRNNTARTETPSESRPRNEVISTIHKLEDEITKLLANFVKSSGDTFKGVIIVKLTGKLFLPIRTTLKKTIADVTKSFLIRAILNKSAQALAIANDVQSFATFVAMMLPEGIRLSKINSPHNYYTVSPNNPSERKYQTMLSLGPVPVRTAIVAETVPLVYSEANLRFSASFTLTRPDPLNAKKNRAECKVQLFLVQSQCRQDGSKQTRLNKRNDFGFLIQGTQWDARKNKNVSFLKKDYTVEGLTLESVKEAVQTFSELIVKMLEKKKASLNFIKSHVFRVWIATGSNLAIAVDDTTVAADTDATNTEQFSANEESLL